MTIKERQYLFRVFQYVVLIGASFMTLLPIVVVLLGAFKTNQEFATTGPFRLPQSFLYVENFKVAIKQGNMLLGFWNTLVLLFFSSLGTVLTGTMTAYVLHRFDFTLKSFIRLLFLWITLIPNVTAQVATFQIVQRLGLYNTRLAGIVLSMGTDIMGVYIYLQFLNSISRSLDESALMDGASFWIIYWKIILPLLQPATITVLIIKCIGLYNDFYMPFLYMPKQSLRVISTVLFTFKGPYGARWEVICAGVILALLPTFILFVFMQKRIYNGLVQGAVKG